MIGRLPLALAAVAFAIGCTVAAPRPEGIDPIPLPAGDDGLAAPILVDEEMRRWARGVVPLAVPEDQRLALLLQSLLERAEAPFRYRGGTTTGVREAWRTGSANCLTFTHLFVGLAREVGVAAYYLRVREVTSFEREGDLVVVSDHVTAAANVGLNRQIIDFSARPVRQYVEIEPIDDRTALALHYSNLGAEAIQGGEVEVALRQLEIATSVDPSLADGWVNLGVARRRAGDLPGAEAAYRRALAADREQVSAYHNLSALLEWRGRGGEARALIANVRARDLRDPWTALAIGRLALSSGQLSHARRLFLRARRLQPSSADPWVALGEWALAAERPEAARRFLSRALEVQPEHVAARTLLATFQSED